MSVTITYFPKVGTRMFLHQDQSPTTIPMTRELPRQTMCTSATNYLYTELNVGLQIENLIWTGEKRTF